MKFSINRGITSGNHRVVPMTCETVNSFLESDKGSNPLLDDFRTRVYSLEELLDSKDINFFFTTAWDIYHHPKDAPEEWMGFAYFHGAPLLGSLELTIYIAPEFKNKGFATAVIKNLSQWALNQKDIYDIHAYIDHENSAAIHAFSNAGYFYKEISNNIEEYVITKEPTVWLGLYTILGIWVGLVIGVVIDMLWAGLILGLIIGLAIGSVMDGQEKEHRNKVKGTTMKKQKRISR